MPEISQMKNLSIIGRRKLRDPKLYKKREKTELTENSFSGDGYSHSLWETWSGFFRAS